MRPVRIRSSASSASSARPSESAPPITPERWPPKYSSQESGAPEVRTVAGVRPGTTSIAGRTSTSTGSAAHMRSSASAFACSRRPACWATASGERLVITLLEQLELLPLAVDSRPEVFGVLSRPDLRANDEVVRVEVEGCPPDGNRLLFLPIGVEGNSFREALEGSRIHGSFRVRRLGRLAGEEPLQIPAHAGVCDVEVLHVVVADDPLGVDEEPARNDLKSEHASKVARTVDQDREAHVPLLHNGPDPLLTLDVLGNGKEAKAPPPVLPATLPPGQLLATCSPGREEEEVEEVEERRGRAQRARDAHDREPGDLHVGQRTLVVDVRPSVGEEHPSEQDDRPGEHRALHEDDELEIGREGEHPDEGDPAREA